MSSFRLPKSVCLLDIAIKLSLLAVIVGVVCLGWPWQSSRAGFNDELLDDYLARQFDWAVHVNVEDLDHYLNYRSATMRPLTKVTLDCTVFDHSNKGEPTSFGRRTHEDRWYHNGLPIGLRRRTQLNFPEGQTGTIIVESMSDKPGQALAFVNTLMGLSIDLQLKKNDVSVVMVPKDSYESVSNALAHYDFYPTEDVSDGKQMSINLRGYPLGKDEYFFLRQ